MESGGRRTRGSGEGARLAAGGPMKLMGNPAYDNNEGWPARRPLGPIWTD